MTQKSEPSLSGLAPPLTGWVLILLALPLAWGGAKLLQLGGSAYYLAAAVVAIACGVLLILRRAIALWLYAALLLGTLAWAVAEVGFDFWPLVPRVSLWWVIALWLLVPWVGRGLREHGAVIARRGTWAIGTAAGLSAVVGIGAAINTPHDRPGRLPLAAQAPASPIEVQPVRGDWPSYGGSPYGQRYSALTQITPANVHNLREAWHIHTGDRRGPQDPKETTYEDTPIKINDTVYVCTPHSTVLALDPATGQRRWRFDPQIQTPVGTFTHWEHMTCRGVSYHDDGPGASGDCPRRIILPTADARLIALNADNGRPCDGFGHHGTVNLLEHIRPFEPGGYYATSPPVVTRDLVIIGGHVSDDVSTDEPSGVIRAYDVHDGHLVWNWDPGRPDDTAPLAAGQFYTHNSPNMWSVGSVDEALGLLYLPMGNQTPDQWGGGRTPQAEQLSAGVVALDVATGHLRWARQFTHHDLWDMDVGGQPSLIDLDTPKGRVPALVASTKHGSIYVLDRRTGEPIVPIHETPAPQGAAPGDHTAPTQPISALNFNPPPVREADMWGASPYDQLWCRIAFRSLRYDGMFTPPSTQGSLVNPGNFGVFDWGGVSVDPVRQVLIANPSYMAFVSRLIPKRNGDAAGAHNNGEQGLKIVKGIPFNIQLNPFLSPLGIPCQQPPWGYVAGVDLRTGRVAWMHKNGTIQDSSPVPVAVPLGVPSLGGTIVTASGVAFLTGTLDDYARAYDVATGRQLWEGRLPAGAQTTPITYADRNGKQYLLVVAGGHGSLGTKAGDDVIAYALPS